MDASGTRVDHDARAEGAAGPRIPSPPGAGSRFVGPAAVVAAAVGYAALWLAERPPGQPVARFLGEACGAEAILLLSCSLVLIALVPYGERWFGGFDRIVVWHRGAADRGRAAPRAASRAGHLVARPDETGFGHALGDVALLGLLVLTLWRSLPVCAPRARPGRSARWPAPPTSTG
jgi:hypothetical protein